MEIMKFYLISPICTKTDMASQEMHQMIFHMLSCMEFSIVKSVRGIL